LIAPFFCWSEIAMGWYVRASCCLNIICY
jgi:hypothetical protein